MSYDIPDDVAKFVLEKIGSVAHMEALLLVRSDPNEEWSVESVAKRLYVTKTETVEILNRLCAGGLLTGPSGEPPRYRYQPGSMQTERLVDRVSDVHSKRLTLLTHLIHSRRAGRD